MVGWCGQRRDSTESLGQKMLAQAKTVDEIKHFLDERDAL
jgi:hypothetical protein